MSSPGTTEGYRRVHVTLVVLSDEEGAKAVMDEIIAVAIADDRVESFGGTIEEGIGAFRSTRRHSDD